MHKTYLVNVIISCFGDEFCVLCILCLAFFFFFLEYVVFTNLTLIGFNYSVNNRHVVTSFGRSKPEVGNGIYARNLVYFIFIHTLKRSTCHMSCTVLRSLRLRPDLYYHYRR